MKYLSLLFLALFSLSTLSAQTLQGTLKDSKTGETLPFCKYRYR
jgi:hypothetical protein